MGHTVPMSITEIINKALNRLDKGQISSLHSLVLAIISQSRRGAKSILSGIASSFNDAVQADGFGQAVNDSLLAMTEEEAEEALGRVQDLSKSNSQEAAVSGVLRELSSLVDESLWESPDTELEQEESPQAEPESGSSLPAFESLPKEIQDSMSDESKQAHIEQQKQEA